MLTIDHLQQREEHWAFVDLVGKGSHVRTVPVPDWVRLLIEEWLTAAGLIQGRVFRRVNKMDRVWGSGLTEKAVWHIVKRAAKLAGTAALAPHDLRRTGSSEELWTRWVEFGALTPVMRDHVWDKPEHSINLFSTAATTATFRRYAVLHTSLLPYFATYAEEAHRTGVPIMRHTVLEFPEDPRSATAEYQYFLGREMLVAPVVQPAEERKLYLPRGE